MRRLFFLFLSLLRLEALSQSPVSDFSIPNTLCKIENANIINNSTNADAFEWDFCLNDFTNLKSSSNLGLVSPLKSGEGLKLVNEGANWYGFASSRDNNKLLRLDFGNSPENVPAIVDLGNPSGLLHLPEGLDVIKANGNWYGFVGSLDFAETASGVVRLDFGTALTNSPSAVNLGNFGYFTRFRNVKVVQQDANLILILVNYNGGGLVRVNYGDSFDNSIGASDIYDTGFISGTSLPIGLNVLENGSNWIAHISSLTNNSIIQLNFGSDLLSPPVIEGNYNFSGVVSPNKMELMQEGSQFYAVISNSDQSFAIIDFKDLNPISIPVEITPTGLPGLAGVDVIRWQGKNVVLGLGNSSNELKRTVFESDCGGSILYSTNASPLMTYTTSGIKQIELVAKQTSSGNYSISSSVVSVSELSSSDINFMTNGVCSSGDVNFTPFSNAGTITSYNWNFGDGNSSTSAYPLHQYSSEGEYNVILEITSSNGCANSVIDTLKIYPPPSPSFTLPSGLICTNNEFTFTNSTVDNFDGNLSYQWFVNDDPASTDRDLKYTFSTVGDMDIKLQTSIPGCSDELTQTLANVQTGPTVGFSVEGKCEDETISFINSSSGDIASYSWDFGNGQSSTDASPTQTYPDIGSYSVSLETLGTNGCVSSTSKNLTIYSKPATDFSLDLPPFSCSGTPSQFNDLTPPPPDSNLQSWSWNFGDASNGTASVKNPTYTYPDAGKYNVSLSVTTDQECSITTQKQVTISQSPTASFSLDAACVNQATHFSTAGSGIKAWQWQIYNSTYLVENPTHVFVSSGTYNSQLTVTADNDCINTTTGTVIVPAVPLLDFSAANACEGQPAEFTNLTNGSEDEVATTIWSFPDASGSGVTSQYTFPSEGSYSVEMKTTHDSGCEYALTKNISIYNTPLADFTMSAESGPPPLTVQFTNASIDAVSYQWQFSDGNLSVETSPSHEFIDLGEFVVDLFATSDKGCTDSFSKVVSVIIPRTELALEEFNLVEDGNTGAMKSVLTVRNNSNYTISRLDVVLDFGSGPEIKEPVVTSIIPGASVSFALSNEFLNVTSGFVCVELSVPNDELISNNKLCIPFETEPIVMNPYPNPSTGYLNLEVVSPFTDVVQLEVINSFGAIAYQKEVEISNGFNQFAFDLTTLSPGIYFAVIKSDGKKVTHRVIIH